MGKKWVSRVELPEEIIVDILSRLPVKALLRFKCVCKLWKSLISSSNFVLSTTGRERAIVFCLAKCRASSWLEPFCFYSVDDDLSVVSLPSPIGEVPSSYDNFKFFGTCNGLIIFCADGNMYLWNPLTRHCRELFRALVNEFHPQIFSGTGCSGLCFDKSSNDYKIVLVNISRVLMNDFTRLDKSVYVASLSKGEIWRDISFPYEMPYLDKKSTPGVLVNGHLHWIVMKQIGDARLIVYFDEEINQFRELPMPDEPEFGDGYYVDYFGLAVLNGCLSMSRVVRNNHAYTWPDDDGYNDLIVMREYGVKDSWTKLCTITGLLVPLHTRISSNIVLVTSLPYMCTYNIATRYLRRIIGQPVFGKDSSLNRTYKLRDTALVEPSIGAGPLMYVESLASVDLI